MAVRGDLAVREQIMCYVKHPKSDTGTETVVLEQRHPGGVLQEAGERMLSREVLTAGARLF